MFLFVYPDIFLLLDSFMSFLMIIFQYVINIDPQVIYYILNLFKFILTIFYVFCFIIILRITIIFNTNTFYFINFIENLSFTLKFQIIPLLVPLILNKLLAIITHLLYAINYIIYFSIS